MQPLSEFVNDVNEDMLLVLFFNEMVLVFAEFVSGGRLRRLICPMKARSRFWFSLFSKMNKALRDEQDVLWVVFPPFFQSLLDLQLFSCTCTKDSRNLS